MQLLASATAMKMIKQYAKQYANCKQVQRSFVVQLVADTSRALPRNPRTSFYRVSFSTYTSLKYQR